MAFLNPLFLFGAIAAAVPIIVHLVRRTRARKEPFPSLMFLRRIEQKTIRRRTLRNLLLLALRSTALLLLALAFARPYFPALVSSASAQQESSSLILIDGSYSMRYGDVMARARKAALDIARDAPAYERVAVAVFGQSFDVLAPLNRDHQPAIAAINQVQPGLEATDYEQAIAAADSVLKDAGAGARQIHLITDFQSGGWDKAQTKYRLSSGVKLIPVDVGDLNASNIAVKNAQGDSIVYGQKYNGKLTSEIGNFSPEAAEVPVELRLNDLTVERRQISIPANRSETVEFTGFNVPAGSNRASVEISGDAFPVDNRFLFSIRREDQQRVLIIETAARGRSESFYLQQALAAGDSAENALTIKSPGTLNPTEIDSYKVVIVNDASVSDSQATALKNFVQRGGGLVLVAARHTESEPFNRLFAGLAPVHLGEAVPRRPYARMSQLRTDHELFAPFARSGRLASPRVYSSRQCTAVEGAVTVAALEDGSPIVVDYSAGKGHVVFIATSLDTAWSDLPLTPMYLPFFRQVINYTSGESHTGDCLIGQTFRAAPESDGARPAVEAPGGGRVDENAGEPGADQLVQAREQGFYRLKYRDRSDYVAVNLDTRESDLTHLNVNDFVATYSSDEGRTTAEARSDAKLTATEIESRQRVWLPLLLAALGVFVLEAVMARRIRIWRLAT
jgi:hypothetical protein